MSPPDLTRDAMVSVGLTSPEAIKNLIGMVRAEATTWRFNPTIERDPVEQAGFLDVIANTLSALSEPAAPAGVEVVKAFGLESPETETLRANGLKPDEIAGDPVTQAKRVRELLHWFVRLPRGSANPKWTREHAFELAYYIATTDDRAPLDIDEIQKAAWLKGVKATHAERDMMLRHGFITKAEFDAALATPQPVEPPDDTLNDIAAGKEAARDDEWGEAGEEEKTP